MIYKYRCTTTHIFEMTQIPTLKGPLTHQLYRFCKPWIRVVKVTLNLSYIHFTLVIPLNMKKIIRTIEKKRKITFTCIKKHFSTLIAYILYNTQPLSCYKICTNSLESYTLAPGHMLWNFKLRIIMLNFISKFSIIIFITIK